MKMGWLDTVALLIFLAMTFIAGIYYGSGGEREIEPCVCVQERTKAERLNKELNDCYKELSADISYRRYKQNGQLIKEIP